MLISTKNKQKELYPSTVTVNPSTVKKKRNLIKINPTDKVEARHRTPRRNKLIQLATKIKFETCGVSLITDQPTFGNL